MLIDQPLVLAFDHQNGVVVAVAVAVSVAAPPDAGDIFAVPHAADVDVAGGSRSLLRQKQQQQQQRDIAYQDVAAVEYTQPFDVPPMTPPAAVAAAAADV